MNLAYRDIRHNLGRFLLTCMGLGLLLGVVLAMIGIYRGLVVEALTIARAPAIDLWVVEANTRGPFAEASRIPGDLREAVARIAGVSAAGSITYQTVETEHRGAKLRLYVIGYEPTRPGGPPQVIAGREIARSHFEIVADRSTGLTLGERIHLGRNVFTVVGLTHQQVNSGGDPRSTSHCRMPRSSSLISLRRPLVCNSRVEQVAPAGTLLMPSSHGCSPMLLRMQWPRRCAAGSIWQRSRRRGRN